MWTVNFFGALVSPIQQYFNTKLCCCMVSGIFGLLKRMPAVTGRVGRKRDEKFKPSMMQRKVLSFTGNKYFKSNNS